MGSLNPDAEMKQEFDDSGYVQDDTASKQATEESKGPQLLDLSDDVLLYILRYCSPQDLKALGFSCPRLGALVLDRTLWTDVDAGGTRHGRRRVRWLLAQALGPHTRRLRLAGYAKEAEGCLGFVNRYDLSESNNVGAPGYSPEEERYLCGGPRVYRLTQTLPRYGGGFPYWPHAGAGPALPPQPSPATCPDAPPAADGCPGPQLTLTHTGLRELTALCTALRTLELEDCVIDCHTINIGMFPKTLTKLSLKGTKCFNLESKSFLFKIQDHLTHLEELDVSYCTWIEPACMLPLSKMPCLRKLLMRECAKLAEFVAYASLATRYGFKQLKYLDLRGSPVGDSEVSALGWLPLLEELYLSPSPEHPRIKEHAHYSQDLLPAHTELEEWEETEPDYFKSPQISDEQWDRDEENVHENRTRYYNTNSDDPSACILLERMIAEPVAPEEYSQVYHQFLAGHQNNMPLANPEEYREAYRQYMERPSHAHPPAGYSLFIRKPDDARGQHAPAKRRKHEHAEPDTSNDAGSKPSTSEEPGPSNSCTSKEADSKPSTSSDEPGPSTSFDARATSSDARATRKRDSDDSSDDDSPPSKRACAVPATAAEPALAAAEPTPAGKAKKDSRGANKSTKKAKDAANKKKKDEKRKLPRRVFEITINELNTLELLVPPDMPNNAADDYADYVDNEGADASNVAEDANNVADNSNNVANNAYNAVDNASNEADDANNVADNANNAVDNANNAVDNASNVADNANNGANDDNKEGKVTKEAKIVDNEPGTVKNDANNTNNEADIANNGNNYNNNGTDSGNNGAVDNNNGSNNVNNGADNDNKEGNVTNEAKNFNNEPNDVNNGVNNANNGANDDNNVNNNANNAADNVNNGVNNANNEANNANNEASNANVAMNPIGQAILDAVNNIFNNEAVASANNNADNAAHAAARTQRIFQFRQYRRPIVIEEFVNACDEPVGARRLPRGVLFSGGNLPGGPVRLDHSALVSDSSIRRFGRAIGENINYIHIGGGGIDTNARPDRSNLRVLSVTGYRRVTDASLTHLATAAPHLRELDVSRTAVSAAALASFRAMRPDVRVLCEREPTSDSRPAPL